MLEDVPTLEENSLLELFRIIDHPQEWYAGLNYQQKLFCRAWLFTGNDAFAKVLLAKVLPKKSEDLIAVAPVEGFGDLVMKFG